MSNLDYNDSNDSNDDVMVSFFRHPLLAVYSFLFYFEIIIDHSLIYLKPL